jgi:predicted ATPase
VFTHFEASAFGCIKKLALDLTPLHALIGPNDSGKSTLLRAIRLLSASDPQQALHAARVEAPQALGGHEWVSGTFKGKAVALSVNVDGVVRQARRVAVHSGGAILVRLNPDSLANDSDITQTAEKFIDSRGHGLPTMLLKIKGRDDSSWADYRARICELFPVTRLDVVPTSGGHLELEVTLVGRAKITARECSEGLLYFLAYSALPYLGLPSKVLLVEEPENGLHPARIAEVIGVLRRISEAGTQVIMSTHSPLVINELKPEEVTIITRDPQTGTIATPMTKTKNFAERSKVYALGELWVSYADGNMEAKLVGEGDA